ncbi:MAG: amino acid permease [Synergistaceae bacterium]|nr:amino acid permease [Synergistaceae bacterium]
MNMLLNFNNLNNLNKPQDGNKLSALNVWAFAFGGVIGWGAFMMPSQFLRDAGPLGSLIAIEIGSFVMLVISCNYFNMIKKIPSELGPYAWTRMAFGEHHAFICAWSLSLAYLAIVPQNASALTLFARILFGALFQSGLHYRLAGYEIYFNEILLSCSAILICAFISSRKIKFAALIQTIFALCLALALLAMLIAAVLSPKVSAANFSPFFAPSKNSEGSSFIEIITGIFSVAAVAPWAFVGFDTVPHLLLEFKFNKKSNKHKIVMDTAILCGGFAYGLLALMAASIIPDWYSNWVEYMDDLPNLHRIIAVPTFYAAWEILGGLGLAILSAAAASAIITGLLGFYIITSKFLCSLADEGVLPEFFSKKNKHDAPINAIIFLTIISMLSTLLGRSVLGWVVDMASLGAAIAYGYTSLAARKFSLNAFHSGLSNDKSGIFLGTLGFIFAVIFAFLLLAPVPGIASSLKLESYISLIIWSILGIAFFKYARFRELREILKRLNFE